MNDELQRLEKEIREEQHAKWLSYLRRSAGMTDDDEKIAVAREVAAMPLFGWHQSWYEHLWAQRHGTLDQPPEDISRTREETEE